MPDKNGILTGEERQKIVAWLNEKGVEHSCPFCNQNNWSIGDHLLSGMIHSGGGLVIGGASYPSVFTVCNNCAYTRQFMAVPIGILPAQTPEGEKNG